METKLNVVRHFTDFQFIFLFVRTAILTRKVNITGKMKAILIGQCENGIFKNFVMTKLMLNMPKVPERMDACKFDFCVRVAEPFINENCTTGLELSVVNIFRSVLGFQVRNLIKI